MSENSQFKVAFTGHRHLKYDDVVQSLIKVHSDFPGAMWITGGAYGLDSHAARFALDNSIPLWLVLPFPSKVLCARWPSVMHGICWSGQSKIVQSCLWCLLYSQWYRISAEMSSWWMVLMFLPPSLMVPLAALRIVSVMPIPLEGGL